MRLSLGYMQYKTTTTHIYSVFIAPFTYDMPIYGEGVLKVAVHIRALLLGFFSQN
jgi:hypothetical protein